MRPLDFERIEQSHHIGDQQIETVRPFRRIGAAMAALVVAQHVEMIAQRRGLLVPHRKIRHQRVGEHHPGRALASVDLAVEGDSVGFDLHRREPRFNSGFPEILQQREKGLGEVVGMKWPASMISNRAPGIFLAMPSVTGTARM